MFLSRQFEKNIRKLKFRPSASQKGSADDHVTSISHHSLHLTLHFTITRFHCVWTHAVGSLFVHVFFVRISESNENWSSHAWKTVQAIKEQRAGPTIRTVFNETYRQQCVSSGAARFFVHFITTGQSRFLYFLPYVYLLGRQ